ncbi:hypothetical protein [Kaarinaea lacus]
MNDLPTEPYLRAFRGSFLGLRRWEDVDTFWETLKSQSDQSWYIYAIGEVVPAAPVNSEQLKRFVDEIDTLLRKEHQEEYCGIVYVDDKSNPTYIKIYDPHNLGVVCGYSDNPPLPGWIISKLPPVELSKDTFLPQSRKRWWKRLFTGS